MEAAQDRSPLVQADSEQFAAASANDLSGEFSQHCAPDTLPLKRVLDEHPEFPFVGRNQARTGETDEVVRRC